MTGKKNRKPNQSQTAHEMKLTRYAKLKVSRLSPSVSPKMMRGVTKLITRAETAKHSINPNQVDR